MSGKPLVPGAAHMNRPRWSQTPPAAPTLAGRPSPRVTLGGPPPPAAPVPKPPVPYGFPQPTPAAAAAQHAALAARTPLPRRTATPLAAVGGTALPVIHNQQAGRLEGARLAGVDGPVRDAGLLPEALEWSLGGKAVGLGAGVVRGGVRRLADALPAAARAPGDLPYFRRLLQARRAIPRLNYPPGGNVPRVTGGFRPTRGADVARDAALRFEEPVAARYGGYYNPASPPYLVVNRGVTPSAAGTARHEASHMLVDLARRGNAGFTPTPLHAAAARLGQSRVPFLRAAGNVADELAARQLEHKALLPRLGDQARYLFGGHPEYARVLGQISPAAGRLYRAAGYAPLVAAGSAGAGAATYGTRALAPYLPARRDAVTGLGALVQPPTAARDVDAE